MNDTQIGAAEKSCPGHQALTVRGRYRTIDVHGGKTEAWPDVMPELTEAEATRAAKRLYRKFMGAPWRFDVVPVSGRCHSYIRRVTVGRRRKTAIVVNPGRGWKELVHGLSHTFFRRLHPSLPPHHFEHTHFEKAMVRYVIENGWLDGKLKPQPK
jgi:hypothetical protein